jgi:hypothetical protein
VTIPCVSPGTRRDAVEGAKHALGRAEMEGQSQRHPRVAVAIANEAGIVERLQFTPVSAGDDPILATYLRIAERELQGGWKQLVPRLVVLLLPLGVQLSGRGAEAKQDVRRWSRIYGASPSS